MKKLIFVAILLLGCADPHVPSRYGPSPHVVTVSITVKQDDNWYECEGRGGIWVTGDSRQRTNEIVGCIEPETEKK